MQVPYKQTETDSCVQVFVTKTTEGFQYPLLTGVHECAVNFVFHDFERQTGFEHKFMQQGSDLPLSPCLSSHAALHKKTGHFCDPIKDDNCHSNCSKIISLKNASFNLCQRSAKSASKCFVANTQKYTFKLQLSYNNFLLLLFLFY